MPISFLNIGRGNIGPLPILVLIMLLFVSLFQIVVNKTKFGKYMRATGENPTAAWLAGINIESYKRLGFILSGLGAAITGVLLTARLGAASPEGASGFLMDGFATALLGQTVFGIGKPTPFGTFIGALIVGTLNNGMTLLGAPYYIQDITKGIIIILSVSATSLQKKKIERR
jgi:ribose transport system permease protein